jgi:hypothetical protein
MRKPFDVLAEGLVSENSRGNWTPIELFAQETDAWPGDLVTAVSSALAIATRSCGEESRF